MWAKLNSLRGLIRVTSPFSLSVSGRLFCCGWMTTNCSGGACRVSVPCVCAVGVQYKVLRLCCTAGDRLLSSALVGRGCFPSFSALVGRVGGWRSLVCAVMSTQQALR